MRRIVAAVTLLFLVPSIAVAQQDWPALDQAPTIAKVGAADVAVLVAVEDYLLVPDVPGAKQNAVEWERFLRDGLGVKTVTMLLNEQATREEMLAAVDSATSLATPDSTVWFVFIGHGAPNADGTGGLLVGADAQQTPRSVLDRGLPRSELLAKLDAGPQKRSVVLLDACFSGVAPNGEPLATGVQPMVPVTESNSGISERTVVMTAGRASEFAGALPGMERPAFSYLVLGGLRGWADAGDDGFVTAEEAVAFARQELVGVPGRRQTPQVVGIGGTVLSQNATEPKPEGKVATAPAASLTATSTEASTGSDARPKPPSRVYVRVSAGGGGELVHDVATPLFAAGWGFRLTNPEKRSVVSLLTELQYGQFRNPSHVRAETAFGYTLTNHGTAHVMHLGIGPALDVDLDVLRLLAEIRGAVALPVGECRGFERYTDLCQERRATLTPAATAQIGVAWRAVSLAAQATVTRRAYTDFVQVANEANGFDISPTDEVQTAITVGALLGVRFNL